MFTLQNPVRMKFASQGCILLWLATQCVQRLLGLGNVDTSVEALPAHMNVSLMVNYQVIKSKFSLVLH